MGMTRTQLARTNVKEIRRKPELFALFKKYAEEDAHLIYSSGRLPSGCFGCQLTTFFSKWKAVTLENKYLKTTKMKDSKKTYKLKLATTKFYFDGVILDRNSSDQEWLRWINYPGDTDKVEDRKKYFEKLPNEAVEVEVKPEPVIEETVQATTEEVKAPVKRTRKKKTV